MNQTEAAILTLLAERDIGATICPSEVARRIDPDKWRDRMTEVHSAVDCLHARERITLSWKGEAMTKRSGPYRIAEAE
ncbi:DUF3253 domain-containing protein [Erythrobacter litoralis]|uniref:DUF3253 domain-containing protein n=1 Tax=Erythrobacter litoralis TaxID=39960 RepID=UPI002434B5A5|nr:DUF3253 domain-containing protein [Erythrobacter litoralis]MDG6078911.1 DUF3253 domain-containing protein [Erythrobacter litoralis]